ncbi:MAG: cyclopropane-fatty-acyl-phospholipid synthase family protein [Salinibacter sp.]
MTASLRRCLALAGTLLLLAAGPPAVTAQLPGTSPTSDTTDKDVPYVPTAPSVVTRMLEVADVSSDDVVYDLGSGDGRVPIAAAKQFGARAVGVEIDSALVAKARAKARTAGVEDLVTIRQGDLFNVDLRDATVVTLYLWPEINIKLRPKLLRQLDPGDRIVSHDFRMGEWEPDRVVDAGEGNTGEETIYLWIVPETVPDDLMDISDEAQAN